MDLNMVDHPEDVVKVVINNVDMEVGGVCCLVGSCLSITVITCWKVCKPLESL